jgi:GTP-binding protein
VLGVVEAADGRQLIVADVPGLIEGASEGIGLGHEFLAHLERARTLVHVIDASLPPEPQWRTIGHELASYGAGLDALPQIVVLNKVDLQPDPVFAVTDERIIGVFRLSCATGAGIAEFRSALFALVPELPEPEGAVEDGDVPDFLVYRPQPRERRWSLMRIEGGFRVLGTPPSSEELDRTLREAGARRGMNVEVGEASFEYAP